MNWHKYLPIAYGILVGFLFPAAALPMAIIAFALKETAMYFCNYTVRPTKELLMEAAFWSAGAIIATSIYLLIATATIATIILFAKKTGNQNPPEGASIKTSNAEETRWR